MSETKPDLRTNVFSTSEKNGWLVMTETKPDYRVNPPQAEYVLDRWPRCEICGKPWQVDHIDGTLFSGQMFLPDCRCDKYGKLEKTWTNETLDKQG